MAAVRIVLKCAVLDVFTVNHWICGEAVLASASHLVIPTRPRMVEEKYKENEATERTGHDDLNQEPESKAPLGNPR